MNLKFIRANKTKHGGAEVYLSRLSSQLKDQNLEHELIHSSISKLLPSWIRVLLFNRKICQSKQKDDLYFSLERISCADIYRAGDGVHKVFIDIEEKSKLNPLHKVYVHLEEKCFKNSKKIIANSNIIKQQIVDTYDIDPSKIEVVYNGIPTKEKVDFSDLKNEFNLKDEKIILYVGSGFKRKGVKEALDIILKLQSNLKFIVVGKEKKLQYYKEYAKSLGLEDKVIFTGPRDDVDKFYSMSDIFLFPTRYEPFSNVVLEAMSYSNAVITTKQNGASEILDHDLVMSTSVDFNIVHKLDNILKDENKLKQIKKRNLEIVQDFTIEKNVEQTLKVIDEVIP